MPDLTTPTGTAITLTAERGDTLVRMDGIEVGRIIRGSFQPVMFCPFGLTPVTLRALADVIEQHEAADHA